MKRLHVFNWSLLLLSATMLIACDSKEEDKGGGLTNTTLAITPDKTQYYPFDAVTLQLSEPATAETYRGLIGSTEITAQRMADSTLVFALPDLTAGEYALSLQIGNATVESKLKIVALPVVSNPEAVIEEAKANFSQAIEEARQASDPNTELLTSLTTAFDNQLSKLSDAERQQLAAYLQAHSEYSDESSAHATLRLTLNDGGALHAAVADYTGKVFRQKVNVFAFTAGLFAIPATGILGGAVCVIAAIEIIRTQRLLIASTNSLLSQIFILDPDMGLSLQSKLKSAQLRSSEKNDYTFMNGGTMTFEALATYRSVTAKDISGTAPSEARQIISSTDLFQTLWDKVSDGINTLRSYCSFAGEMTGRPRKVSQITTPDTASDVLDNWTLTITSGDVTAQKVEDNTYTFTTTSKEDVKFKFKVRESSTGAETKEFLALLTVKEEEEENCILCGTWKYIRTDTRMNGGAPASEYATDEEIIRFTSTPDGSVYSDGVFIGTYENDVEHGGYNLSAGGYNIHFYFDLIVAGGQFIHYLFFESPILNEGNMIIGTTTTVYIRTE